MGCNILKSSFCPVAEPVNFLLIQVKQSAVKVFKILKLLPQFCDSLLTTTMLNGSSDAEILVSLLSSNNVTVNWCMVVECTQNVRSDGSHVTTK